MTDYITISTNMKKSLLAECQNNGIKRSDCLEAGAILLLGKRKDFEVFKEESAELRGDNKHLREMLSKCQMQIMLLGEAWKQEFKTDPLLDLWEKTR